MFCRHAATGGKDVDWLQLNNSLYAETFLAQQNGKGRTCLHCLEMDHQAAECALAPKTTGEQPQPVRQNVASGGHRPASDYLEKGSHSSGGGGRSLSPGRQSVLLMERRCVPLLKQLSVQARVCAILFSQDNVHLNVTCTSN